VPNSPGRVVVLVSGSGTNLQALLDAADDAWSVVGVVSDRVDARALERAAAAGVPCGVVAWSDYPDRGAFTDVICERIAHLEPDLIVLAGFMRILGPAAVAMFPNRIINVHPSLLPAFAGVHAVRQALSYGVTITGVTVHFVDEHLDGGAIILQEPVAVEPDDDEESLHRRIQQVEHRVLPQVVSAIVRGSVAVQGRIVRSRVVL